MIIRQIQLRQRSIGLLINSTSSTQSELAAHVNMLNSPHDSPSVLTSEQARPWKCEHVRTHGFRSLK